MPKKRPVSTSHVLKRMHIYCEGEKTEPNYLISYIDDKFGGRLRDVVVVEDAKTNTPVQLVREAIKHKSSGRNPEGDVYWVVYDRESVAKYKDALHDTACELAKQHGVLIALSNVCFEYWLILHFVSSDAPYSCFDDLLTNSCLKDEIRKRAKGKYEKGASNIYNIVAAGVADARRRAKNINARTLASAPAGETRAHRLNPYTDIPALLDAIDSFQPQGRD